jgi:hypothetical protein
MLMRLGVLVLLVALVRRLRTADAARGVESRA